MTKGQKTQKKLVTIERRRQPRTQTHLGAIIDNVMKKHDIKSNEVFGSSIGVSNVTISRVRQRVQDVMRPEKIVVMAKKYELPVRQLLLFNAIHSLPAEYKRMVGEAPFAGDGELRSQPIDDMAAPVVSEVFVDLATWRRERKNGRQTHDIVYEHARTFDGGPDVAHVSELQEGGFLFLHEGSRMVDLVSREQAPRIIPDKSIVLVRPIEEQDLRNGDIVLVQFLADKSNKLEQDETAKLYVYTKKTKADFEWEEYQSINKEFPVRHRTSGKFNEQKLQDTRIILGRATRIVHSNLL